MNPHMYVLIRLLPGLVAFDSDEPLGFHVTVVLTRVDSPEQGPGGQDHEHQAQGYQQEYDCHAGT